MGAFVRLLAIAFLGALTTVAVSWGIAAWFGGVGISVRAYLVQIGAGQYDIEVGSYGPVMVFQSQEFEWQDPPEFEFPVSAKRSPLTTEELKALAPIPAWSALNDPERGRSGQEPTRTDRALSPIIREVGSGWPRVSMVASFRAQTIGTRSRYVCTNGIPLNDGSVTAVAGRLTTPPALPLGIYWPGFLANTGVFALSWLAVAGLPAARRLIRVGRGRCGGCAYPLGGLQGGSRCPECGREMDVAGPAARAAGAVIGAMEAGGRRFNVPRVRRALLQAFVVSSIGIVVTVGVAWWGSVTTLADTSLPANLFVRSGSDRLIGGLAENAVVSSVQWVDDSAFELYSNKSTEGRKDWLMPPAWSLLRTPAEAREFRRKLIAVESTGWLLRNPREVMGIHETSSGWPMRALVARFRDAVETPGRVGGSYVCVSGIGLPEFRDGAGPLGPRGLPVVPYWPGFLTDVAFFGLVAYGVLFWRPSFRGRWRVR